MAFVPKRNGGTGGNWGKKIALNFPCFLYSSCLTPPPSSLLPEAATGLASAQPQGHVPMITGNIPVWPKGKYVIIWLLFSIILDLKTGNSGFWLAADYFWTNFVFFMINFYQNLTLHFSGFKASIISKGAKGVWPVTRNFRQRASSGKLFLFLQREKTESILDLGQDSYTQV